MKKTFFCLLSLTALFLDLTASNLFAGDPGAGVDRKRNQRIASLLSHNLPAFHFSHKEVDDELAEAIFTLYIKQLDYQKRFLLASDVDALRVFESSLDDNLKSGRMALPDIGYGVLNEKRDIVEKYVSELLADDRIKMSSDPRPRVVQVGSFHILEADTYETDPDTIEFVADLEALRERWRILLKMQVISQYLDLVEEQDKAREKAAEKGREQFESSDEKTLWRKALTKVRKRYSHFFERLKKETLQDHYDRYFNCVTRAFGPHTNYISPVDKEQFDINMRGSLEGIGALLREDDGLIKVVRIIPGSASARQGHLKAGDIIYEVAQEGEEPVDVTDMRLRDAVRMIRGPKGETVTLTVKKTDGAKESIRIVRDVVQIEEAFVKSATVDSPQGGKTGYLYIPSFYRDFEKTRDGGEARNCTDDTRKEIAKLKTQGVNGIIVDLRDDGGGALMDAVDIAGLFIASGPVVQIKNSFGDISVLQDTDPAVVYDGPMVVLVNQFSASASEIVAAAMQDYGRAVIVGAPHTHGKGTVQRMLDLNESRSLFRFRKYDDLGALKVMTQKFYRINGSSTQYRGVEPDIVLPNLYGHIKSGERYLDYSLPWDAIAALDFTADRKIPLDLSEIKAKSAARAASDEGLQIIAEEAEKALKKSEDTTLVVQYEEILKKRREAEEAREKIGAHYLKYREREEDAEKQEDLTEQEDEELRRKKWLEEVNNDPYIREAANIIADIAHQ
ncbi:MAG: tail-specific protease [Desulfobacterales bacterium]|nr:MAG: tail-specific protease [Desulfobacterales bacterium]